MNAPMPTRHGTLAHTNPRPKRGTAASLHVQFGQICCLVGVLTTAAISDDRPRTTRVAAATSKQPESAPVVVHLRPSATVRAAEVSIGDIAVIDGGSTTLRSRITRLDVADAPRPGQTEQISRDQVIYRLQLAGLDDRLIQVRGAKSVSVTVQMTELSETELVETARQALVEKLGPDREDFDLQLSQPLRGPFRVPASRDAIQLDARIRPGRTLVGKVPVAVAVHSGETTLLEVPMTFEVRLYQRVAVAKRRIERGQSLTKDSFQLERRSVDGTSDLLGESADLVGARVQRTLLPTQVISTADLELTNDESPVLVRPRDVVKIVVQSGNLRVTATGEVLQNGRAGEMIRVRNVDSQTVVLGRVRDRSVVEIRM